MSYFAVSRARGTAWDPTRPMREQDGWDEHAAFMDGLHDEGFVLLGGPLGVGEHVFMLIVEAADADAVRTRLADDPWMPAGMLRYVAVEPWELFLGSLDVPQRQRTP
jgi:uncharacterized protein YciI